MTTPIYIYESPDNGKTIYRRIQGGHHRELVGVSVDVEIKKRLELWRALLERAQHDSLLNDMISRVEIWQSLRDE